MPYRPAVVGSCEQATACLVDEAGQRSVDGQQLAHGPQDPGCRLAPLTFVLRGSPPAQREGAVFTRATRVVPAVSLSLMSRSPLVTADDTTGAPASM